MFFVERLSGYFAGLSVEKAIINDQKSNEKSKNILQIKEKNEFDVRSSMYTALSSVISSHSVPSLVKSLDSALLILRIAKSVDQRLCTPEIDEFYEYLNEVERNSTLIRQGFVGLKVLCIEGLEGSGKSTLIDGLVTKTGAITTENNNSADVQKQFIDAKVPEIVATALAFALNYCCAYQIVMMATQAGTDMGNKLFIIKKFHHFVCSRTICDNVSTNTDLKSLPASAFVWPMDLPEPTLVIFLMADTNCRVQRIFQRDKITGDKMGSSSHLPFQEGSIVEGGVVACEEDIGHDNRVTEAYSLVTGPPTIGLDASLSAEDVLTSALEACEEFDIYTPPVIPKKKPSKRISMGIYGEFPMC